MRSMRSMRGGFILDVAARYRTARQVMWAPLRESGSRPTAITVCVACVVSVLCVVNLFGLFWTLVSGLFPMPQRSNKYPVTV
jgi:hypothetical protein